MVTVVFDTRVIAIETVKKATYRLMDKFTVDFQLNDSTLSCNLSFSPETQINATSLLVEDRTVHGVRTFCDWAGLARWLPAQGVSPTGTPSGARRHRIPG